jgi:molecular chaperone GrpE
MSSDGNDKRATRIPIRFIDNETRQGPSTSVNPSDMDRLDPDSEPNSSEEEIDLNQMFEAQPANLTSDVEGGPATAELVATRAELKRILEENGELKDRLARRQADFENYRKRVDRERTETYNRVVADVASKLLGVLDNLKRALETEASVEATESDEFRHFLSGVDLIYKQLNGVLEALGVKPVVAVGEKFDPHIHEAVVTEASDDFEPDTVMQEIRAGYLLGDKLIRPALVKVSTRQ